jgi:NitT/TauT family transport system ATP-binding protein
MMQAVQYNNTTAPDIIELKNIKQTYGTDNPIIDGLNFLVEEKPGQGQINVIMGPSGCGKSTILRYIAGLQAPSSGEVLLYGKPRTKNTCVSMVFQDCSSIKEIKIEDDVALPLLIQRIKKSERLEKIKDILKFCDLEKHMGKWSSELSGGQQQRVAIARCLVANPHILLMDEPFNRLDIYTRQKVQDLLLSIQKAVKPTVIFISHDISEAVYVADEIHIMSANPGFIIERIKIDLGSERNREIKKSVQFIDYVKYIDERIMVAFAQMQK